MMTTETKRLGVKVEHRIALDSLDEAYTNVQTIVTAALMAENEWGIYVTIDAANIVELAG